MSLKIAYTFVAEDRFTQTVKRMNQQANRLRKTLNKNQKTTQNANKTQEDLNKSTNKLSGQMDELIKKINRLSKAKDKDKDKTKGWTATLVRATNKFTNFSQKIAKLSDKFGMGAYFRLMNIAIPMGIVAKLGTDYADSLVRANSVMNNLWGTSKKNVGTIKQIRKEATHLALTTPFSRAAILQSGSTAAMATGNIQDAKKLMPDIARFASITGVSLAQATQKVITLIRNNTVSFEPGFGRFYGSTQNKIGELTRRLNQPAYAKMQQQIVAGSPGAQLKIMLNQFKQIAGTIMLGVLPGLIKINSILKKIAPQVSAWVKKHKELFKIIGMIGIGSLGFLATLSAIGAIIGTLAMPFELLAAILRMGILFGKISATVKIIKWGLKGIAGVAAFADIPIALILTAIAAIGVSVYEIYKHWDAIEKKIISVYKLLKHDITHPSAGIHDIKHALTAPANLFPPGVNALFHPDKSEINVHIHDKGNNVSHVESKGESNVKTTLSQTYAQHQLGLNMSTY